MNYFLISAVVFCILVGVYCAFVLGGESDDRMDRLFEEEKKRRKGD